MPLLAWLAIGAAGTLLGTWAYSDITSSSSTALNALSNAEESGSDLADSMTTLVVAGGLVFMAYSLLKAHR